MLLYKTPASESFLATAGLHPTSQHWQHCHPPVTLQKQDGQLLHVNATAIILVPGTRVRESGLQSIGGMTWVGKTQGRSSRVWSWHCSLVLAPPHPLAPVCSHPHLSMFRVKNCALHDSETCTCFTLKNDHCKLCFLWLGRLLCGCPLLTALCGLGWSCPWQLKILIVSS